MRRVIFRKKETLEDLYKGLDQELVDHFKAIDASLGRLGVMIEEMKNEEAVTDALLKEIEAEIQSL